MKLRVFLPLFFENPGNPGLVIRSVPLSWQVPLFLKLVSRIIRIESKLSEVGQSVQKGRSLAIKSVLHSTILLAISLYAVPVHWLCFPKRIFREVGLSHPLFCPNLKSWLQLKIKSHLMKLQVNESWL